jgi:hypothetical protein
MAKNLTSIGIVAILLGGAAPVSADTDPCAGLSGAGWGLCHAYCTAMMCGSADQEASDTACTSVKSKFIAKTGLTRLPCEGGSCACTNAGTSVPFTTLDPCMQCELGATSACQSCAGCGQLPQSCQLYPGAVASCTYQLANGNFEVDLTTSDQRFLAVQLDTRGNIVAETTICSAP